MEKGNESYKKRFEECDDKFNRIFQLTSAASKIIAADLTILKINKAVTELLGYAAEEIEGTKILDFACEEYKEHWHHLQEGLWSRQLPFFKLEACLKKKDGSIVWVNVTTILFNENGKTYGFTVLDDFTYRKNFEESEKQLNQALAHSHKIQETLRRNEQHLAQILETMAEGVIIVDDSFKLTYINPMAQKILGKNESELLNRSYNDNNWHFLQLNGLPLPFEEHPITVMMKSGKPVYDSEIAIQPDNNERIYISINAAPIFDNGSVIAGVSTFMDVTNRRKITELKDEFISVASHELRTPVTSLKASLQLLNRMKHEPSPKMMPNLIEQANKSLNKVSLLITDLLNASKFNEGRLYLNKTLFIISKIIDDCCYDIRLAGEYEIITEGDTELKIYADPERIDQVTTNLINNAIKYAPESKQIRINIERLSNMAKISVIDKGPGIPPEKLPHLFDRYYRVDSGGFQFSGLGLGLYISSEIIKKHGGEIGVDSVVGQGSTFWFTLPLSG
jgi:two-component system CheB/CheR fusion protein